MTRSTRLLWAAASLSFGVAIVLFWQYAADQRWVNPAFLPSPMRTWTAFERSLSTGKLQQQLEASLVRMFLGWVLASVVGIVLGALIGVSASARAFLGPTLEFLRPLPASAIIPVAIALLGLSEGMVLFVICFGSVWPLLLATMHGVTHLEPRLVEVAKVLRMSRFAMIWKLAIPSAMPDILSGLRLSMTVALILTIVCEMLTGASGLGQAVLLAARAFRSAELFVGVVVLGLIGYATSLILTAMERYLLRWRS
jgi:sulfonate transport system permease protein